MSGTHTKKSLKGKTDLASLHHQDDSSIDYSDNPASTEDFWKDAKLFVPSHKIHLSLRLNDEIVEYFKKQGPGYQSRINSALKAYVRSQTHH